MSEDEPTATESDGVNTGHIDGAEYFIYVFEQSERYECPECGAQPISWSALESEIWTLSSAEELWSVVPSSLERPGNAFDKLDRAVERLDVKRNFTLEGETPRCAVCEAAYPVTVTE